MKAKVSEFITFVKSAVGSPYLWGGQGETLYDIIRATATKKGQSTTATNKMLKFLEKDGIHDVAFYDCSGLGVYYLLNAGAITKDMTANTMKDKSIPIDLADARAGDWVFFIDKDRKATHVGYMISTTEVVHALDQTVGVVLEKLSDRKEWNYAARPEFCLDYDLVTAPKNLAYGDKVTISEPIRGYMTSANALAGKNSIVTYPAGTYYVYKVYNGAVNITKHNGTPGAWVVL